MSVLLFTGPENHLLVADPDDLQTTALLDWNSFPFEEVETKDEDDEGYDEVDGDDEESDEHDGGDDEEAYAVDALAQQQSIFAF